MTDFISIKPATGHWVVRAAGAILGETDHAMALIEGASDPVIYFPPNDIAMAFLERSDAKSTCPHKGEAVYYHIEAKSGRIENAAWAYDAPSDVMAPLKGYLAFYPERVAVEQL